MSSTSPWFRPCLLALILLGALAPRPARAVTPASALFAAAESSSAIRLSWVDSPDELGYRVERSPDGTVWLPVATLPAGSTTHLDSQRPAATSYYYRVVATQGIVEATSNVAFASTFPASAVKVCAAQVNAGVSFAVFPSPAWNGAGWGVVYADRKGGKDDELMFVALAPDSTPLGPAIPITVTDPISTVPTLRWDGSRYGLLWNEVLRAEGDEAVQNVTFFAVLDAAGQKLTETRLLSSAFVNNNGSNTLVRTPNGWGVFLISYGPQELVYFELDADGRVVTGPTPLTSDGDDFEGSVSATWNGTELGVTYTREHADGYGVYFQRVTPAGATAGAPQLLFSNTNQGTGFGGTSTLWNGTGWVVAYTDWNTTPATSIVVHLARLDASGALLAPPTRMSDDVDDTNPSQQPQDRWPFLVQVPGGYAAFVSSRRANVNTNEATRLLADLNGVRQGSRSVLSPIDARPSDGPRPAVSPANGILLVWEEWATTREVGVRLLDSSGDPTLVPPGTLTSGHGDVGLFSAGPRIQPFRSGFVGLWNETAPSQSRLQAFLVDGSGALTVKSPLSTLNVTNAAFGLSAVDDTFAVAWSSAPQIYFCRYDASGNAILPETAVATLSGGSPVQLAFSGESYGVVYLTGGRPALQRVAPSGALVGGAVLFPNLGSNVGSPEIVWAGSGWGVVWRVGTKLYFALVTSAGTLINQQQIASSNVGAQYRVDFDGTRLGVVWSTAGLLPNDVFFASIAPDGTLAVPPTMVVDGQGIAGTFLSLTFEGDRHRLIYRDDFLAGLQEIEILPSGAVAGPKRPVSQAFSVVASAWNGQTTGIFTQNGADFIFETRACLLDPTRPPCPTVSASTASGGVLLSWPSVTDPESGLLGYTIYRDGTQLTTTRDTAASHLDLSAFATHVYEVRALSRAFQESSGCATLTFCTLDTSPPAVTPPSPASVTVGQTSCLPSPAATLGELIARAPLEYGALDALLNGGSAQDDCPSGATRLTSTKDGQDIALSTRFPVGASTALVRFRDGAGNVGTAAVTVNVRRQGDLDLDGSVGIFDLVILANQLVGNVAAGTAPFTAPLASADCDSDGDVDLFDLVILSGFLVGNVGCVTP